MASAANYDHHSLPAPPHEQEQYYTPYQQRPPAAQGYQYQSHQQAYQTQYQDHPHQSQYQQHSPPTQYYQQQSPPSPYQQQPPQTQYQQPQHYLQESQPQQPLHPQLEQSRPPLPPPPLKAPDTKSSQQQQQHRPKSRAFSFRSDKSRKSGHSYKIDLTETSAEKEAKRLHSKADPRMALNEREPAMEAQTVSSRPALRSIQHKDANGNPIADPDRSNPTRSRWERPLDTIRSFEAAIDGGYNRKSMFKQDTENAGYNRRSNYYTSSPRPLQDPTSYYNNSGRVNRGESGVFDRRPSPRQSPRQSAMMTSPRDSYYESYEGNSYVNGGPTAGMRNKYSRQQPEANYNNGRVYPIPNNHQSYETVASGSGTGSMGEPVGYQTDPTSSENSSINRRSPPKPVNDYGINFGQSTYPQAPNYGGMNQQQRNPSPQKVPTPVVRSPPAAAVVTNVTSQERPATADKRKSWFVRRFSKKEH